MPEFSAARLRLFRFGPFELDVRAGELRKHGIRLRLREQPLRILLLLLERRGEVVLRTEIRDQLWPNETVVEFDHGINAAIKKLRDALGESAEKPRYIETVARRGYRFLGEIEVVEAPSPDPAAELPAAGPDIETDDLEGKSISHYLVLDKLGSGGMGVVFRAKDLKLKRSVALKFLPEEYSSHPQPLERFQREARAAAALNHPNICTIYEIGEHQSRPFIAMELLEGRTLRDLLAERPLQPAELLELAMQISGALDVAHRRGIVHRDIKPANLFVTHRGQIKILDFGLAKLLPEHSLHTIHEMTVEEFPAAGGERTGPSSPIGTVAYMSPEQVRGEDVDARSDIFSLGVVLYEMAGGRRAFAGESSVETMNAILRDEPAELPASVSPALDYVVRRCLEKQPAQRFQSAAELGLALQSISTAEPSVPARQLPSIRQVSEPGHGALRAWIAATAVMGALLIVLAVVHFREKPAKPQSIQFSIFPPAGVTFGDVRYSGPPLISPDGTQLVFGGIDDQGANRLWVRPLGGLEARPLAGTDTAMYPFWSPDSRWVAFFGGGKLRKVSIDGGPPRTLADAAPRGGTWARADDRDPGTIVVSTEAGDGLQRLSAAGGEPVRVTALDPSRHEVSHAQPQFLSDGHHFLFLAVDERLNTAVSIADIHSKPDRNNVQRVNLLGTSHVWWAPPGYLLFLRDNNLMAQTFDDHRFDVTGDPFVLAEHVGNGFNRLTSDFSVSATGALAWRAGFNAERQLAWFDRSGKQLAGLDAHEQYLSPRLSPDGGQVAAAVPEGFIQQGLSSSSGRKREILLMDLARESVSPFVSGAVESPVWSADASRIAFGRNEPGQYGLYSKAVRGSGDEELLLKTAHRSLPVSWSHDGRFILSKEEEALFVLPILGERKPVLVSEPAEIGEFSPDARWIAYASGESGRFEIVVRSFAGERLGDTTYKVTLGGGLQPRWRHDGRELFYWDLNLRLMAVPVSSDSRFRTGAPELLFDTHDCDPQDFDYNVSPDGQRFLISRLVQNNSRPVNIALDWFTLAKK
ncbi:MAG: protein kinase domain-containing protein [Bryobacteraceae bacterium]